MRTPQTVPQIHFGSTPRSRAFKRVYSGHIGPDNPLTQADHAKFWPQPGERKLETDQAAAEWYFKSALSFGANKDEARCTVVTSDVNGYLTITYFEKVIPEPTAVVQEVKA